MNINILKLRDITEDLLHTFDRYQETCKVYRVIDGIESETKDFFEEEWSVEKKREICAHMK
ncbi:hypothetical protein [Bacillus coahuilensis]|uniref:hypothetical protein n=1 Tax=Bacillus coahuilensis TaxID=408580 RepID=UPI0007513A9C|nr:hypothetical protein [Bacillus coahuilensis]